MPVDQQLAAFCEREHPGLVGSLTLYLGDRHVAEELAQDALVRLCQHWPRVRDMASPEAWLRRVAFNLARSMLRRRSAERRAMARHGGDTVEQSRDDATVIALRQAVGQLPPRMREAVIRRYVLGEPVRSVAESMHCADGTVKALTHKGIQRLRALDLRDQTSIPTLSEVTP